MDRAAIGRPQREQQMDWTLIESQALPLEKLTENGENRIRSGTILKESSESSSEYSDVRNQDVETNLSVSEKKKFAKMIFDSLIPDGPATEIKPISEIKVEKKEKSHHLGYDLNELSSGEGCLTSPYSQVVHMKGCESKFVLNRFCHGTCSSVYFPQMRSRKLKAIFENYKVCRPAEVEHVLVKLECENGTIIREIPRIKRCACVESDAPLPD
uniref:Bursicon n=1 Tax=Panagrolaimus sp. JU765 TaxID=591449 RepID=A0AC34Q2U0_9BILA